MTYQAARLLRLQKVFAAQQRTWELRLIKLEQLRRSREITAAEVGQSLASPLVATLPLLVNPVRRLDQHEEDIARIDRDICSVRGRLIEAHARSELSGETARLGIAANGKNNEADALLEMVAAFTRSSLPQVEGD